MYSGGKEADQAVLSPRGEARRKRKERKKTVRAEERRRNIDSRLEQVFEVTLAQQGRNDPLFIVLLDGCRSSQ